MEGEKEESGSAKREKKRCAKGAERQMHRVEWREQLYRRGFNGDSRTRRRKIGTPLDEEK